MGSGCRWWSYQCRAQRTLAQSAVDFIQAQSSLLTAWDGLVDPLTAGWGSSATAKYSATRHEWPLIGSGAGTPSNDRNNPLYQANEAVDWERAFAFRWQQRFTHTVAVRTTNTTGATQIFWGGNNFTTAPTWLGQLTEGLGFWTTRVRTASNAVDAQYDNYYFMSLRCQDSGVGGSPVRILNGYIVNEASHTTLYNGALRPRTSAPYLRVAASGGLADAQFGFFIPETDPELDILIQGVGGYIYVIVNGTLYARIDVSDLTTLDYGPRFGWLGDGSGTNGNVSLLRSAFVGTPDPINAIPDEDSEGSEGSNWQTSYVATESERQDLAMARAGSPLSVVTGRQLVDPDATDRAYPRDPHAVQRCSTRTRQVLRLRLRVRSK